MKSQDGMQNMTAIYYVTHLWNSFTEGGEGKDTDTSNFGNEWSL